MAPPELREALGELCGGGGGGGEWSYAVFWRADRRDPGLLIVEDSYYEDQVGGMVGKMINHFHIIGEGIIGEALVSGKCRWMYADTDGTGLSQTNPIASQEIFQGNTWWQHQFLEGIKVPESSEFINKVQDLLKQLGTGLVQTKGNGCIEVISSKLTEDPTACVFNSLGRGSNENTSTAPTQQAADNDLYNDMVFELSSNALMQECLDDIVIPEFEKGSISGGEKDLFSELSFEQLLEAIVGSNNINKTPASGSVPINVKAASGNNSEHKLPTAVTVGCPSLCTTQIHVVNQSDKVITAPSKEASSKSHFNLQIDDSCSMNTGNLKVNQPKSTEEAVKVVKKRARPGESTRPRPKDRQLIQDRVKELREIVPNGAKCSIDALLDRTIKHMLFLQSVTKYAEKIKQADEPKMIGDESGVVLKDNSSGSSGGGATWAYEVAGQTMVCPIIVEDLTPPGQMLIEMLCEERGFFLEIADIIRGYGLTILKGVMEIRESKIWSRFLVEANRDITRMDIFLSLVQLLQQTNSIRPNEQLTKVMEGGGASTFKNYQQSPISIPVGLADRVQ
ncbi:Transcription factor bHLH157 [Ananas comosus]|uniref:Transcription factor bHLH157 n=1 Tax=Ananas comosus TaxID=4615 RepID=A0A199UIB5_ANACO|nr:Transcription factor bHLH157 [Ananas comosus]